MTGVAVLLKVMLFPPQALGPKAQTDPSRLRVGFQRRQPGLQGCQPTSFLVDLARPSMLSNTGNLTLGRARAIPRPKPSSRNFCYSLTDATLPSSDTRTPLNIRAGIP